MIAPHILRAAAKAAAPAEAVRITEQGKRHERANLEEFSKNLQNVKSGMDRNVRAGS